LPLLFRSREVIFSSLRRVVCPFFTSVSSSKRTIDSLQKDNIWRSGVLSGPVFSLTLPSLYLRTSQIPPPSSQNRTPFCFVFFSLRPPFGGRSSLPLGLRLRFPSPVIMRQLWFPTFFLSKFAGFQFYERNGEAMVLFFDRTVRGRIRRSSDVFPRLFWPLFLLLFQRMLL